MVFKMTRIAVLVLIAASITGCGTTTVKTVTVTRAPATALACIGLINDGKAFIRDTVADGKNSGDLFLLVADATEVAHDDQAILARAKRLFQSREKTFVAREKTIERFEDDATKCEAALAG